MRVTADRIGHAFPGQPQLFRDISFVLEPGMYALCGPSGSGKSTLLGILAGWIEPKVGTIRPDGITRMQWVFQNPHGVARRTAIDHVVLPYLADDIERPAAEAQAYTLLERFQLEESAHKLFRDLSGGEAQRLMLARAVAAQPDLLLVDEPTAQLDPQSAGSVVGVLDTLATGGAVVVIATHDERVSAVCSRKLQLGQP
ncbi:ATP-binding cassette domain-containing protein [Dactylosporangium sp. NPDC051541]|uniref:ATP-binding cassette domain-containing protein n=1 Tax=Dactylosporangium sp. NPDC051541 TaxID=3363977 RepID=UPI00378B8152